MNQLFTRYPNQTAYDKSNPIITFNESIIYLYFIDVRLFVYIFPFSNACIKKNMPKIKSGGNFVRRYGRDNICHCVKAAIFIL